MSDLASKVNSAITSSSPQPTPSDSTTQTPTQKANSEGLAAALSNKEEAAKAPPKPEAKQAPKETPPEPRKFKTKDGMEVDEAELVRGYEHNKAANKKFEEAAALRKQAEQAFEMLKDPAQLRKILEDPRIGLDARKWAEDYVWEKMQEDALTPEQKERKRLEREVARLTEAESNFKTQAEQRETEELETRFEQEYQQTVNTALDQSGLPKTAATVRRMAQYLQLAAQHGLEVTPADLAARVKQDLIEEHKSLYSSTDGAALASVIGEDLMKKIREADIKRLKSTQPVQQQRQPNGQFKPKKQMDQPRQKVSAELFKEMLTEKLKG